MKVQSVLFPTDFSTAAERALPHALEISRRFGARLTILYVRSPFADDPASPEFQFFDQGKYESYVESVLADMCRGIDASDQVDTATVRNLSAGSGILEFAFDNKTDIIVMGTHGRSALSAFLMGSVAEKVVRHARCPVLTVAQREENYRDRPKYEKILAAFDFSEPSKDAVRRGRVFADAYQAKLAVLYVVEQIVHPAYDKIWQVSVKDELPNVVTAARKSLAESLGEVEIKNLDLEVQVGDADGKAEKEIIDHARAKDYDLIVMGTKGLSGLDYALLGSTTERVVRTAPCPVLTFHDRKD